MDRRHGCVFHFQTERNRWLPVGDGAGVLDTVCALYACAYHTKTFINERNKEMTKTERHMEICKELNEIYDKKNHDYGDSFHKTFVEWGMATAGLRLTDKLNRFTQLAKGTECRVDDESIIDTLNDLANYAIMTRIEIEGGAEV